MQVLILHHFIDETSSIADRDVQDQIDHIKRSLESIDIQSSQRMLNASSDLSELNFLHDCPDVVFYLVETFDGRDRWMHLPASKLDRQQIPYTGSPANVLELVNDKHAAKLQMLSNGIPTARWIALHDRDSNHSLTVENNPDLIDNGTRFDDVRFIIKSRYEHASVFLEDDAVKQYADGRSLIDALHARSKTLGPCLAEEFIDGREFNLSVLEMSDGTPQVMTPAEIDFSKFPHEQPKLVGYRAKWVEDSIEYQTTPRRFLASHEESELQVRLQQIALQCWQHFGLRGYARVDFRVDKDGQPWVLEINANPCIAPWSGFTAACQQSGLQAPEFIGCILKSALRTAKACA